MPSLPGDDYLYRLKFQADGQLRSAFIQSLSDYFESTINHFNWYNNRVFPHAMLQLLLLLPEWVFDVLNTIVFLLLPPALIGFKQIRQHQNAFMVYCVVLAFIWIFHFDIGRSYFWTSGALNYSWMLVLQLVYLRGIAAWIDESEQDLSKWHIILAIMICTTNENIVLALTIFSASAMLHKAIVFRKAPDKTLLVCTIILAAGGLIMLMSPALDLRTSNEGGSFENSMYKLAEYAKRAVWYIICYLPCLLLFLFNKKENKLRWTSTQVILLVAALVSMLSMVAAPLFEPRTAIFGFMVCLMICISMISFIRIRPYLLSLLFFVTLVLFIQRIPLFAELHTRAEYNQELLEGEAQTMDTVFLKPYCKSYRQIGCLVCDDISDHPDYIHKEPMAAFYKIKTITIDPQYSFNSIYDKFGKPLITSNEPSCRQTISINKPFTSEITLASVCVSDAPHGDLALFKINASSVPENHILIIRGAPKGINRYRLIDLLPKRIRLYFLEYLEYHQEFLRQNSDYYNIQWIQQPEDYKYYLISLYDLDNHTPVGQAIRIDPD